MSPHDNKEKNWLKRKTQWIILQSKLECKYLDPEYIPIDLKKTLFKKVFQSVPNRITDDFTYVLFHLQVGQKLVRRQVNDYGMILREKFSIVGSFR